MLNLRRLTISCVLLTALAAIGQSRDEAELLAIHQADRRAHFNHDVDALLVHTPTKVLDVRDGKVGVLSREDVRARFVEYFRRANFTAWDDVQPPIVHVSSDGRTGWMIVRVHIAYTETDDSGKTNTHDETMAWMSAYEKQHGKWMMTAVTSTSDQHLSRSRDQSGKAWLTNSNPRR